MPGLQTKRLRGQDRVPVPFLCPQAGDSGTPRASHLRAMKWILGTIALLGALLVGAMLAVQSEWAEARLENLIAERIGREVDLEDLRVRAAWPPQVELGRLRIANPEWARDDY